MQSLLSFKRQFLRIVLLFGLFNPFLTSLGQNRKVSTTPEELKSNKNSVVLKWTAPKLMHMSEEIGIKYLFFEGASYDPNPDKLPAFEINQPINDNSDLELILSNEVYQTISEDELKGIEGINVLEEKIVIQNNIGTSRGKRELNAWFVPLRKSASGRVEKLISFNYSFVKAPTNRKATFDNKRTSKSTSVLAKGDWYKFGVTQTGVYKLDYQYFKNLGIDVRYISPNTIRVFGNNGGMLPVKNSEVRPDDLMENAIYVFGEEDGKFDSLDYVLFYGQGASAWVTDKSSCLGYSNQLNLYSDSNYYFVNVNQNFGKRVGASSDVNEVITHFVSEFDELQFHEKNKTNLVKSGRESYGEYFDVTTTLQFVFNFPNLVTTTPVAIKMNAVGRCVGCNSSFLLSAEGTDLSKKVNVPPAQSAYYAEYMLNGTYCGTFNSSVSQIPISLTYDKKGNDATGYLNYIELKARRQLIKSSPQMSFIDYSLPDTTHFTQYTIGSFASQDWVWDITTPWDAVKMNGILNGSDFVFKANETGKRNYITFNSIAGFLTPGKGYKISNQNLHALAAADYIIVAHPLFLTQAKRLGEVHKKADALSYHVVTTQEIYNEFSSGRADVTAIKDFLKMLYDRGLPNNQAPKYLLLFGDGSYDNLAINNANTNFIPTYESENSTAPIASYVSEDYFGLLDDNESDIVSDLIDLGIGRLPVKNVQEAEGVVSKIETYLNPTSYKDFAESGPNSLMNRSGESPGFGDWRNIICFVGDDQDRGVHMNQADAIANQVDSSFDAINIDKIYLDSYKQEVAAGGQRYPEVSDALNRRMDKGALIVNYTGHGGEIGWAHERILDIPMIQSWKNLNRLPLFLTATCEFSRFDDPSRTSAGELVLLNPNGGGIGLLTTTRLVYSTPNYYLNLNFYKHVFDTIDGQMARLGDIVRLTKKTSAPSVNNRNFTLLGDPAIRLAYPQHKAITTQINSVVLEDNKVCSDTVKALSKITVKGFISDYQGAKITGFNGVVYPTVYDKKSIITSLGNDQGDDYTPPTDFQLQKNIIYRGKVSVTNGDFEYSFIVPKDINYNYGLGRISYYAEDGSQDANGSEERLVIGGYNSNAPVDNAGPEIKLYMNDEKFISGGLTNEAPNIYTLLFDENGINTVGNGIGHDISAVLDANTEKTIILNDYYQAELNSYQKGTVRYKLNDLAEGSHTLKLKAWDVYNNSSESNVDFIVSTTAKLALQHVLNYPNPFTTKTAFFFEHNKPSNYLQVNIQIFTVNGKLVKTIDSDIFSDSYRSDAIEWDGRDEFGDKIGRGVYLYKLKIRSADGSQAEKIEKLVLLN